MAVRTVSILGGNWSATTAWTGGVVPIAGDTVNFTATSGNLTVNSNTANLAGIDFTNYINTITINSIIYVSGTINLGTGGYTQAGTNGLTIINTNTITSNGTVWSRTLTFSTATSTTTLSDNLYVTGNILLQGAFTYTLNGNSLYVGGSLDMSASGILGTTNIIFNGTGTWSHASAGYIANNITIDPTAILTIGTSVYWGGTSGNTLTNNNSNVITTGSTLTIRPSASSPGASVNINTPNIIWNNITVTSGTFVGTINLLNDLYFSGTLVNGNSTIGTVMNGSTIYCMSGRLDGFGNGSSLGGTSTLVFKGSSTWYTLYSGFSLGFNVIIDCERLGLSPSGTVGYHNVATVTYVRGSFNKTDTFRISGNTLINFHKAPLYTVICNNSSNTTMNEFFSGSPNRIVNISSSGATNYTITFQDGFEKISKFVNINNCTLSKPQQLLVITNSPRSSTNTRGIRYINQSPNGIAKGEPSINAPITFGAGGLLSDPNMR